MNYSSKTIIIGQIIVICFSIMGVFAINRLADTSKEEKLVAKLFGYTMLTAFKVKINSTYLPLGPIIAYVLMKKSLKNKKAKSLAIILGIFLIFYPSEFVLNKIEQSLYPRNNIRTYLVGERRHGGIATIFYTKNGISLTTFTADILDNEIETADMLYNELINCEVSNNRRMIEYEYFFHFNQDIEDPRFGRLEFKVGVEAKELQLDYENKTYIFNTSEEFQKLFKDIVE
ncbi:hypothetical protein [Oceanirhabdus seepicola]|uniref:Uncharacterized protein n=1 Tax=Oceanirhabdus seepicola TaxID=2828781 RepID=A0A9J6P6Z8_9CLOT|nr:hypothetical protein [Oceanirhabdus seepicola]MCM1991280.1 hypothetical protein [Oceanirhabdus seepicola]